MQGPVSALVFILIFASRKKCSVNHLMIFLCNRDLGIFSRTVAQRIGNTRAPNVLDALVGARIGRFMPTASDYWWEIDSEDDAYRCAR